MVGTWLLDEYHKTPKKISYEFQTLKYSNIKSNRMRLESQIKLFHADPPDLLDTPPNLGIFWKNPLTSIYYHPPIYQYEVEFWPPLIIRPPYN